MITTYLSDMINDHKTHSGIKEIEYKTQKERRIQLTMLINFMSCKDSEETRTMHTKRVTM